jgi:predicted RNase H-like HicB family nuclease
MQLRVVFEPSDEGGYTVFVPALPGCISEGDTLDEARENIREAIALYLEPIEHPARAGRRNRRGDRAVGCFLHRPGRPAADLILGPPATAFDHGHPMSRL